MGACGRVDVRGRRGLVVLLLWGCALVGVYGDISTWRWNHLKTFESSEVPDPPTFITKLDNQKFNIEEHRYRIEGEGAGTIFSVNDEGKLYVIGLLDREKKSLYHLTARLLNRANQDVEPSSNFVIEVQDINDNAPVFHEPFKGFVPEMSVSGTVVMTVNATDDDDPTTDNGKVRYKLLNGTDIFSIDEKKGTIRTKVFNLDRETTPEYKIMVQAKDSAANTFGLTDTATVTIRIEDINDNMATFKRNQYIFRVREDVRVDANIGTVEVEDKDEEQNKNPIFKIDDRLINNLFEIKKDQHKNGVLSLKQPLDYEKHSSYRFTVTVTEETVNAPHNTKGHNKAEVVISVIDVDEPPVFDEREYNISVREETFPVIIPVSIKAKDPDMANRPIRYSIEESCPIAIDPKEGTLSLKVKLDREYKPLHRCQVTAEESLPDGQEGQKSYAMINLVVQDVNDHAPKLSTEEIDVCESDRPGTVIATLSAIDKDEISTSFTFRLAKPSSNFTLSDNNNGTATLLVKQGGFKTEDASDHALEIEVADGRGGPGVLKSVERVRIKVCQCASDRTPEYCRPHRRQVGVSVHALITILLCIVTILVIVILLVLRQRYRKDTLVALGKSSGEIHEQLVTYDEEGGGEMDTNGYDVSILTSARHDGALLPGPGVYARVNKPPACKGDMAAMIEVKKDEADHDRDGAPYDTLHIYGYEGPGSLAGSLSSLESSSSGDSLDYDFLNDWGPRFRTLAELYGVDCYAGDAPY
ncbi:hypothetical protein ACEWY4_015537 [Coilia grayii]|uniref:Cadherin-5 n=1 Tax=Coilia grayii TaxID=363190 RepID=A0ABD1JPZ4_9TELE